MRLPADGAFGAGPKAATSACTRLSALARLERPRETRRRWLTARVTAFGSAPAEGGHERLQSTACLGVGLGQGGKKAMSDSEALGPFHPDADS